jgi:hypothetical protein
MHMADPLAGGAPAGTVQHKCAACEGQAATVQRKRAACESEPEAATVQRKRAACESEPAAVQREARPSGVLEPSRATERGGAPLPSDVRAFFEPRFGHDFSGVRVHADAAAEHAAHTLDARAFTAGRDVVFARGEYAPTTAAGRRLLAHELTHVIQQGAASPLATTRRALRATPVAPRTIQRQPAQSAPAQQTPAQQTTTSLQPLNATEAAFAQEAEGVRVNILSKALPKVQQAIQDILTGSTGVVIDKNGRAQSSRANPDTLAVIRAAMEYLNVRPNTFDWLNDPKDKETLDTLTTAARLMSENLAKMLPKRKSLVPDPNDPNAVARNDKLEVVLFPSFWGANKAPYPSPRCHGIILLHEYFHHLVVNPEEAKKSPLRTIKVYHGEDSDKVGYPSTGPMWPLSNAYSLTSFTVDVALGELIECVPGWKPTKRAGKP